MLALAGGPLALLGADDEMDAVAPLLAKPLPASSVDAVDDQPSPQHVFISGHWSWREGAYTWENGCWELPPSASAVWVAPRWEKRDDGFALVEGYWTEGAAQDEEATEAGETDSTAVVVEQAPPPPERETIVARPSPQHVWLGGYWSWREGEHVWNPGHWDLPPRPNVVWVAPRWARRGHGYVLVAGGWRDSHYRPRTTVIVESDGWRSDGIVTIAPPPPRHRMHDYRTPRPSYEHVWTDGYWAWHDGRHVWINGCWQRPPDGRSRWVAPRWEHRKGGYIFVEGTWR